VFPVAAPHLAGNSCRLVSCAIDGRLEVLQPRFNGAGLLLIKMQRA